MVAAAKITFISSCRLLPAVQISDAAGGRRLSDCYSAIPDSDCMR
jgi:hypothetical protein